MWLIVLKFWTYLCTRSSLYMCPPLSPPLKKHIPTPMVTHHLALIDSSPKA